MSPDELNARLRFVVHRSVFGRVTLRYFKGPRDAEGTEIRLSPAEADDLAFALTSSGFHSILEPEPVPDRQLVLHFGVNRKEAA